MELSDIRHASTRIQMEFIEMPEMRLTRVQVRRLLNLPLDACEVALASLVQSGFLAQTADGAFLRGSQLQSRRSAAYNSGQLAPAV